MGIDATAVSRHLRKAVLALVGGTISDMSISPPESCLGDVRSWGRGGEVGHLHDATHLALIIARCGAAGVSWDGFH